MSPTSNKQKTQKSSKRNSRRSIRKWVLGILVVVMIGLVASLGLYLIIILNGASILKQQIDKFETAETTLIFDANQKEIAKLFREHGNRESVESNEIPILMKQAFIAIEDKRFESHSGVDLWAIGRAFWTDITKRRLAEGGSTITQQLAKNVFLSSEKTFFRKATEVSVAIALEARYSKDEILEKYFNRIFFGQRAYGVKAASKVYFAEADLHKLELWQMATLAALPKAPSRYSPISNPEKSKERRAIVLQLMMEQGYITDKQREEAAAVDYQVPAESITNMQYASFVDYVVDEAEHMYGITEDELLNKGYRISTTMDQHVQSILEQTYANPKFFQKDAADGTKIQSAMVILDHRNGSVLGLVGGRDYISKGYHRVNSLRQPGSAIKPIAVYAPAIETGIWNPYSFLNNTKQTFGTGKQTYQPQNYNQIYSEEVTMFEAVQKSINISTVWLLDQIGVQKGFDFANKLGLQLGPGDRNLAMALGGLTQGVSPMQMATAYGAFANQGIQNKSHVITKIVDRNNQDIVTFAPEKKRVMSAKTAYYTRMLLESVVQSGGTGTKAYFNRPLAGKTGSTNLDWKGLEKYDRDVWFVGFTPEWTAAVWQGFDQTDTSHYVTVGSGSAANIFKEVMSKSLKGKKVVSFTLPTGVAALVQPVTKVTNLGAYFNEASRFIQLQWNSLGETYGYEVYRKAVGETQFQKWLETPSAEAIDSTVLSGETYVYYVIGVRIESQLKGEASEIVEVTIPSGQATLPDGEDTLLDGQAPDSDDILDIDSLPQESITPDVELNELPKESIEPDA